MDEQRALWVPSPHHWEGREGYTPRWIILHGTAGGSSAQAVANWFAEEASQASTNYIVGRGIDEVVQCVVEANAAWSNGAVTGLSGTSGDGVGNGYHDAWWDSGINPNLLTISIEHVKPHDDNSDSLTETQKQASFELIKHICQRWNIPARKADKNGGITGHFSMDPENRKLCPGAYPWDELWSYLQEEEDILNNEFINTHFDELPDGRLKCKSNNIVVQNNNGLAAFYRSVAAALRLPMTNIHTTGHVVWQRYESAIVVVNDPKHEQDSVKAPYVLKLNSPLFKELTK